MSVTELPHRGEYVQIEPQGRQTVFGYSANTEVVRTARKADGSEWADIDDGWRSHDGRYASTIADMLRASLQARKNSGSYRLEVSPEIAAHLRASGVYGVEELCAYYESVTDDVFIDIPLGTSRETEGERAIGHNWHTKAGVKYLRVSPDYDGVKLVELDVNEVLMLLRRDGS